jgi:hypothetical protein
MCGLVDVETSLTTDKAERHHHIQDRGLKMEAKLSSETLSVATELATRRHNPDNYSRLHRRDKPRP